MAGPLGWDEDVLPSLSKLSPTGAHGSIFAPDHNVEQLQGHQASPVHCSVTFITDCRAQKERQFMDLEWEHRVWKGELIGKIHRTGGRLLSQDILLTSHTPSPGALLLTWADP